MSTEIGAVIVNWLAFFLPMFGIKIPNDQLNVTVQVLLVLATGLWLWVKRVKRGGVTAAGIRK